MKRLFSLLLTIGLGVSTCFPQIQAGDHIIQASPTVAELGKYGAIPVSHYTGTPQISIPICEVTCGQLSLPISLSYHAGGVRVDQIASWIGMGWSLNAGGVITPTIMGVSDFKIRENIRNFDDIKNGNYPNKGELETYFWEKTGNRDYQPDIYNYNFAGFSGQFVMDENFTPHEIRNNTQLKITCNRSEKTFFIVDDMGNRYYFSLAENTRIDLYRFNYKSLENKLTITDGSTPSDIRTGWFLSRIVSADSLDVIDFVYTEETHIHWSRMNGQIHYDLQTQSWRGASDWENEGTGFPPMSFSKTMNTTQRLTAIETNKGTRVDFIAADSTRADLTGSNYLSRIIVKYSGVEQKRWDFTYSYFHSYINHPVISSINMDNSRADNTQNNRLKLTAIRENGKEPHLFEYYGDDSNEPQMPYRTSFSGTDYWGYLNDDAVTLADAQNVKKLFPKVDTTLFRVSETITQDAQNPSCNGVFPSSGRNYLIQFLEGSNKSPHPDLMKTYSLKKITYPTKGYTQFEYEPHEYSMVGDSLTGVNKRLGGLRIKTITDYSEGNRAYRKNFRYTMLSGENMETETNQSSGSIVNENMDLIDKDVLSFELARIPLCEIMAVWTERLVLELSSSSYTSLYSYGGDFIGYSYVTETDSVGDNRFKFFSIKDFPNSYESLFVLLNYGQNSTVQYGTGYKSRDTPHDPFLYGHWGKSYGRGLLHKSATFNTNNQLLRETENTYNFQDLKQVFGMEIAEGEPNRLYFLNIYFHRTGQALLEESIHTTYDMAGGNPVEVTERYQYNPYNKIRQKTTTTSDGGLLVNRYSYAPDIESGGDRIILKNMADKYMIAPYIDHFEYYKKGAVEKIISAEYVKYKELSSGFRRERVDKLYSMNTPFDSLFTVSPSNHFSEFLGIEAYMTGHSDTATITVNYPTSAKLSYNLSHNPAPYTPQGEFIIEVRERGKSSPAYTWSSPDFNYEVSTNTHNADGDIDDINLPPGVYDFLIRYSNTGSSHYAGNCTLSSVSLGLSQTLEGNDALEPAVYYEYDSSGNVCMVKATGAPAAYYIWGYYDQYPVAKIVCDSEDENFYTTIRDAIGTQNLSVLSGAYPSDNQIRTIFDNLRNHASMENALITSYTYAPLKGITSQTDPRGEILTYEYDDLGRLLYIKDSDGNPLNEYKYHYAESNNP